MTVRALAGTKRTINAVRKADRLPVNISGNGVKRVSPSRRGGSSASGTSTLPVKITAKTDYNTYTADVFGDGLDQTATVTGATIRVLSIATTETIPTGTILFASPLAWADLADVSKRKDYYTIDPARSY